MIPGLSDALLALSRAPQVHKENSGMGGFFAAAFIIIWIVLAIFSKSAKGKKPTRIVIAPPPPSPQAQNRSAGPPRQKLSGAYRAKRNAAPSSRKPQPEPIPPGVAAVAPILFPAATPARSPATPASPVSPVSAAARPWNLDPKALRQQVVMADVLGKPLALRQDFRNKG